MIKHTHLSVSYLKYIFSNLEHLILDYQSLSILYDILILTHISNSYFLQHFVYVILLSFKVPQHICNHSSHLRDRFPTKFISSSQHFALYYDRTCSFCCANFNSKYFITYKVRFSIGVFFYFIIKFSTSINKV